MIDVYLLIAIFLGVSIAYTVGMRWWRNREAAKKADDLLAEIVKGKDAFRR